MDAITPGLDAGSSAVSNGCGVCAVRCHAICSALSETAIAELNRLGRHVRIRRGQTLFWEGDDAVLVGNVVSGILKLSTTTRDGREQIVGMVYPSDFVGRPFGGDSNHSVVALADSTLCVFRRADFDRFAGLHPDLEQALLRRTLDELDRARRWMLLLGRKSAEERVASLLLELVARCAGLADSPVTLPLSRQQMADVLGLTIETVSRCLTRLRSRGIISFPTTRQFILHKPAALADAAGD